MMNKILHVFPYEKFTFDYISAIERCFNPSNHTFFIVGKRSDEKIKSCTTLNTDIVWAEKGDTKDAFSLLTISKKFDKVIFHSLFFPPNFLITLSIFIKSINKKVFWNIWGGDLYNTYRNRMKFPKGFLAYIVKKNIITNIGAVGYIKSDYRYLCEWFKVHPMFFLASYAYEFHEIKGENKTDNINILIGNSATESCRHKDALDIVKKCDDKKLNVWCILSYPKDNTKYIEEVIQYGYNVFGERFKPIVDFLTYYEYEQLLSTMDIAIFNNDRQQALGNIAELLFHGKKVYISPDNGCLEYFQDMGANVYSTEEFCILNDDNQENDNSMVIRSFFSDEQFADRWKKIFETSYTREVENDSF